MDRLERSMLATAVVSARVIPYAVDAETFKGGSQPRAREALSLDAEASVLLFVSSSGSVNPYKDYETVRRAARIVAQARPVVLAVVGRSQEDERDGDLLVRHVGYLDSKDELAEWYRASDLLVHASWEESFGIVVAEALACGLPVVATRVGGVPEVMADGEHGSLVEPGNPEAMAEAVRRLISDPALRERMGEQGAAHVRREFGEAAMTERYIDFCRHAIDDHPLRAARSG
jgi:glycosyltransferase involved in cell wall biosynthesis